MPWLIAAAPRSRRARVPAAAPAPRTASRPCDRTCRRGPAARPPESLTPAPRLTIDSTRSPTCAATAVTAADQQQLPMDTVALAPAPHQRRDDTGHEARRRPFPGLLRADHRRQLVAAEGGADVIGGRVAQPDDGAAAGRPPRGRAAAASRGWRSAARSRARRRRGRRAPAAPHRPACGPAARGSPSRHGEGGDGHQPGRTSPAGAPRCAAPAPAPAPRTAPTRRARRAERAGAAGRTMRANSSAPQSISTRQSRKNQGPGSLKIARSDSGTATAAVRSRCIARERSPASAVLSARGEEFGSSSS